MKFSITFLITFALLTLFLLKSSAQEITLGLLKHQPDVTVGYSLFTGNSNTYLIDNCGNLIHHWESEYQPATTAYLLENGDLIRPVRIYKDTGFGGGGLGGGIQQLNWQGEQTWYFEFAEKNKYHQHHDIAVLPGGNILILAWEYKSIEEAITYGRLPEKISNALWPTLIVEVEPVNENEGKIVWEWHLWDHLIQEADNGKLNYGSIKDHPELLDINFLNGSVATADWLHCNAIEYVEPYDWIVLSSKYLHEIYVIDHSTTTEEAASHKGGRYNKGGDFLYRWGNPQAYQQGTDEDQQLFDQHDVTFIEATENEPAQFLVFNNGTSRPKGKYSSVLSFALPLNENNEFLKEPIQAYEPQKIYWQFQTANPYDLYSPNGSSAQRLNNGNTLIAEGNSGNFFEINKANEIIWAYQNPVSTAGPLQQGIAIAGSGLTATLDSDRIRKYPADFAAFKGKDMTVKGKIELNSIENDCIVSLIDSNADYPKGVVTIYPNPVKDILHIHAKQIFNYKLFSLDAVLIKEGKTNTTIKLNKLPNGFYFLQLENQNRLINSKILIIN